MKRIEKGEEPNLFTEWKAKANADWQPTYDLLSDETKTAVKKALMEEQGYICCYCERRLTDDDSHIEHFRPQSDQDCDDLDFSNMLCSCQDQTKKGEPRHCGVLKDNWFDLDLLVSPFDPICEYLFTYTADGGIGSADSDAATTTISKLGLDISKLFALRKGTIAPFLDPDLSDEDFLTFVTGYLKALDNRFSPFHTTIRFLFAEAGGDNN